MSDQRVESLKAAIGQIERQFGKGAVMRLGDDGPREKIESISTGSLKLDQALGIGGCQKEELWKYMVLNHLEKPH